MASRLPRLHSSPDHHPTLKRKAIAEEDNDNDDDEQAEALDQPRKLPAIGELGATRPNRPLHPSKTTPNLSKSTPNLPKPLTKPRAPPLTTRVTTRGTSAPPTNRPPPSSTNSRAAPLPRVRSVSSRTITTTSRDDKRFNDLQSQLSSIDAARAADAARLAQDMASERAKVASLQANHEALSRQLAAARTHELTQRRELVSASDELEAVRRAHAREIGELEGELGRCKREVREFERELGLVKGDLERERGEMGVLRGLLGEQSRERVALDARSEALQMQVGEYVRMMGELTRRAEEAEGKVEVMKEEVREGEMVRRRLHNMVMELKGNIRVFARVRPVLSSDVDPGAEVGSIEARMLFPDRKEHKEIVLESSSESAMGQERKEMYQFSFDRVFEPCATQGEVFEEISQLAQSCMDGYNVCIFAYGQTGSGKSFTMEGGMAGGETAGMIPRAVEQVFRDAEEMKGKGWEYTMEGQFLEIYNETINDLLGSHDFDKKKHEIKHDAKTGVTRVTDVNVVPLKSAAQVRELLGIAQGRRSVAATMVNERSSRGHSVFTLRIRGVRVSTGGGDGKEDKEGERCEGSLNLVDLAGSERINVSFAGGAEKERIKETQSINKSLSALGDVIAALGERGSGNGGGGHVPYRNSKLTYLLQNSLSGNSKTLMFLNLSPLAAHLNESLTSLRFATKVNNTNIGTAKKQVRLS